MHGLWGFPWKPFHVLLAQGCSRTRSDLLLLILRAERLPLNWRGHNQVGLWWGKMQPRQVLI